MQADLRIVRALLRASCTRSGKEKKIKKKGQVRKEKRGNEEEERRRGAKATQSVETTEKPR